MKQFLYVLVILCLVKPVLGEELKSRKTLRFITHEAHPLMDAKMPGGGVLTASLRQVFAKMGYDIDVTFVSSWARAKIIAKNDKSIDGYFPYTTKEMENIFIFSDYFIENPWVIIERAEDPIRWSEFSDLTKYTAGNVTGVELRPGVKELVEAGKLKVETTSSDIYNLQKLANKRVDMIFMDSFVFNNIMATRPEVKSFKSKLQINPKAITIGRYGIAVRKGHVNKDFLPEFNRLSREVISNILTYSELKQKMPK